MYNTILNAVAEQIAAKIPSSPVYVDEIPQNADGSTFVRIVEDARSNGCNRSRYDFSMEVLHFQTAHDTFTYGEWVDDIYTALGRIEISEIVLFPKNCSARQDKDNRFYQFAFDIEFTLVGIPQNELMETLKTDILEVKHG